MFLSGALASLFCMGPAPTGAEGTAAVRVLTYNVGAVPGIEIGRGRRLSEIARFLEKGSFDVVAIQEAWVPWERAKLIRESRYPYFAEAPEGGVVLLSRHPIEEFSFTAFEAEPPFWRFWEGDALGNKGLLSATIRFPKGKVAVFTTHFVARYGTRAYRAVRLMEIFEASRALRRVPKGRPALLLADFNFLSDSPEHYALRTLSGFSDSCRLEDEEVCPPTHRDGRIDGIWFSGPWNASKVLRLDPRGPHGALSDHHPLLWTAPWPEGGRALSKPLRGLKPEVLHFMEGVFQSEKQRCRAAMGNSWLLPLLGTMRFAYFRTHGAVAEKLLGEVRSLQTSGQKRQVLEQ